MQDFDHPGLIIACAYCVSPISEDIKICSYCGGDATCDPGFEFTPEQYASEERVKCSGCDKSIFKIAIICPFCQKKP